MTAAEEIAERLRHFVHTLDLAQGDTVTLRTDMLRLCGEHGAQWTTSDECQWCGGFAVPLTNQTLTRGGKG